MKRNFLSVFFVLFFSVQLFGQGETYNWCFGDSAFMKYTGGMMITQSYSIAQSMEANASISGKNGDILFYISGISQADNYLKVCNKIHQTMPNGDSLLGYTSATNGVIIVPFPSDTNKFYIFSTWYPPTTFDNFLYKHVIDISLNSGIGDVIQKNILLLNQPLSEKIAFTRHGNGKDWWLIFHGLNNNDFYTYLIDSSGIHSPSIQSIGTTYHYWPPPFVGIIGEMIFSNNGTKLIAVGPLMINYFDFDRCTGLLSNFQNLTPTSPLSPNDDYYGCSFASNDSVLYVSNLASTANSPPPTTGVLCQFDLTAPNIKASRQTLYSFTNSTVAFGQHQLAPDGKIYITTFYNTFPNYTFDSTTMYLSTIENPNTFGLGCNFQLHSFYLGGHRALAGLPNMPNYNLGTLTGSPCDTITGIKFNETGITKIAIYPNPFTIEISINIQWKNLNQVAITIKNILGETVFIKQENNLANTCTKTIDLSFLSNGIYLLEVNIDGERTVKKIVKV